MPFYYTAFNLTILSEIELPALLPISKPLLNDVYIQIGEFPIHLKDGYKRGILYESTMNETLYILPSIARFFIQDGKRIVVEPFEKDEKIVALFICADMFPILLQQRGILVLQGACIQSPIGSLAFVGTCGIGKSTLLAKFVENGYFALSDDILAIVIEDKIPLALPAYPIIDLWADILPHFNYPAHATFIRQGLKKQRINISASFVSQAIPLGHLYFLVEGWNGFQEIALNHFEALQIGIRATYHYNVLRSQERLKQHFVALNQLLEQCPSSKLVIQHNVHDLNKVLEFLNNTFY